MSPVASRFDVKVVGLTFRPGYPEDLHSLAEIIAGLPQGASLEGSLVRESRNPHDSNAVAVLVGGEKRGYLPRELAARVGPEIDEGARFRVTSAEVLVDPDHADRPGLLLRVERVKENQ